MAFNCISKLAWSWPPCPSPNLLNYGLKVCLWVYSILVCKHTSTLTQLWPPWPHYHGSWTQSITAAKCISLFSRTLPPSFSPYSLHYSLECKYISKFTRSWYGAMVELTWHSKGNPGKMRFFLYEECRERLGGYELVPSHEKPHKLPWSMKARQECMRKHPNCMDI